jgi:histidinol dehydrogenase
MQVRRLTELEAAEYRRLMQRSAADVQRILPLVQGIMEDVRERGDAAVREYSTRFDGVQLEDFRVSAEELAEARQRVEPALLESLRRARENLEQFHRQQLPCVRSRRQGTLPLNGIDARRASPGSRLFTARVVYTPFAGWHPTSGHAGSCRTRGPT